MIALSFMGTKTWETVDAGRSVHFVRRVTRWGGLALVATLALLPGCDDEDECEEAAVMLRDCLDSGGISEAASGASVHAEALAKPRTRQAGRSWSHENQPHRDAPARLRRRRSD